MRCLSARWVIPGSLQARKASDVESNSRNGHATELVSIDALTAASPEPVQLRARAPSGCDVTEGHGPRRHRPGGRSNCASGLEVHMVMAITDSRYDRCEGVNRFFCTRTDQRGSSC